MTSTPRINFLGGPSIRSRHDGSPRRVRTYYSSIDVWNDANGVPSSSDACQAGMTQGTEFKRLLKPREISGLYPRNCRSMRTGTLRRTSRCSSVLSAKYHPAET